MLEMAYGTDHAPRHRRPRAHQALRRRPRHAGAPGRPRRRARRRQGPSPAAAVPRRPPRHTVELIARLVGCPRHPKEYKSSSRRGLHQRSKGVDAQAGGAGRGHTWNVAGPGAGAHAVAPASLGTLAGPPVHRHVLRHLPLDARVAESGGGWVLHVALFALAGVRRRSRLLERLPDLRRPLGERDRSRNGSTRQPFLPRPQRLLGACPLAREARRHHARDHLGARAVWLQGDADGHRAGDGPAARRRVHRPRLPDRPAIRDGRRGGRRSGSRRLRRFACRLRERSAQLFTRLRHLRDDLAAVDHRSCRRTK